MITPMKERRAEWIWRRRPEPPGGLVELLTERRPFAEEQNRFVYFRKRFELPAAPSEATIHISADGRYQLFVNGQLVGRGPARCDPAWQYYDTYDIAAYLRPGANVFAVLGHSYGRHMSWYQLPRHEAARALGCGGIFVQADIQVGGQTIYVDSDDSWRYLESEAWQRDAPSGAVGFAEIFDARRAPVGWQSVAFDDSDWPTAEILSAIWMENAPPVRPFRVMVPRDIPFLRETPRRPTRLHRWGEVVEATDQPSLPRQIGAEPIGPLDACRADGVERLIDGSGEAVIQTVPGRAVAMVFDFGEDVSGRPRFDITAPDGAIIDIGYSERLQDDHIEPQEATFITSQNVDRVITRAGRQQWERFEWTGFRYLQLTVRNAREPVTIHNLDLNFTTYPVEYRGRFECSDPLLNRIWRAGAYTLQLCMHDGYEDCPQREQRQWVGDAYVESLINFVAFGDPYLTAKLLRQVAQSQRPDGMTQMATPCDFAAEGEVTITDYCLYWLMTIREYIRYTGDREIVAELFPAVVKAIAWFERHLDDDGLLNDLPHWLFVDWAVVDKRGESTVINAQFHHTLEMCAELADIHGAERQARSWRALADRVRQAINAYLWDDERGVYVDARINGRQSRRVSQHANGICLAYGVAPQERWERIIAYIMDPERVKLTSVGMGIAEVEGLPPFDESHDVVLAQPFFMHHVHRGLIRAGRPDLVLANIRQRWGAMLEAGGTTIWEVWLPFASQCHGWAGTPTFDLSTSVLGVMPLADGFARTRIAPQPVDLTWARGACPTPLGEIEIAWERRDEAFRLDVQAPEPIALEITLPMRAAHVEVNGQVVWADGTFRDNTAGIAAAEMLSDGLQLSCPRGGAYHIRAT